MASLQTVTLTIPSGQTLSEEFELRGVRELSVQAPATLTGDVTWQSSTLREPGGTFATVQSPPGTDIGLTAGKTAVFTSAPFPRVRLSSTLAESANRLFVLWMVVGE